MATGLALNALVLAALLPHTAAAGWGLLLVVSSVSCCCAAKSWWCSPYGLLQWTGVLWCWTDRAGDAPEPVQQACEVRWTMDFQSVVLVYLRPNSGPGAGFWIWLEQRTGNFNAWDALRRALLVSHRLSQRAGSLAVM